MLKYYDIKRKMDEEEVKKAKQKPESFKVPELVKERNINGAFERFNNELNTIDDEIRSCKSSLEDAFE